MGSEPYKQYIPDLQLSIEKDTQNVPSDGCYYVVRAGTIRGKYRSLRKAEELFHALVKESGYKPKSEKAKAKTAPELSIERYLDAKDLYWAESHKFRGKGGRGGRGGV